MPEFTQPQRSSHPVRDVLVFSLSVTTIAGLFAYALSVVIDARWSLVFVYSRWAVIAALILAPFVTRAIEKKRNKQLILPWALRTPITILVLVTESVLIDILIARLTE